MAPQSFPTVLVFGYGNPARGDDGLGPALARRVEEMALPAVTVDSNYQLTVEDSWAVAQHDIVVFADASRSGDEPCSLEELEPSEDMSFSSHSVRPEVVLGMAHSLFDCDTPAYVLGIRGYRFDMFDTALSERARGNLDAALEKLEDLIQAEKRKAIGRGDGRADEPTTIGSARS
jgi:hydrogenase maturation protease